MTFAGKSAKTEILVAGAGPAGASLSIRLAKKGFRVRLIEREKFPRRKLCGEFISPECFRHFEEFGVLDEMLSVGGERISRTVFYEPGGKSVSVPSEWFGDPAGALSLSRAAMDLQLLDKAGQAGVEVLENTQATGLLRDGARICGVRARGEDGETVELNADIVVDATGRTNALGKLVDRAEPRRKRVSKNNARLVGFKAHHENADLPHGVCEIYFFEGGYGGLSFVEGGLANFCFLIRSDLVRKFGGGGEGILREVVFQNKQAARSLADARAAEDWLAVAIEGFGVKSLSPAPGLFSIGDAAAFIDPFTGSGMLMALESAEIFAEIAAEHAFSVEKIADAYKILHRRKFQRRLLVCASIRRLAFAPRLAGWAVKMLDLSVRSRQMLARATRQNSAEING